MEAAAPSPLPLRLSRILHPTDLAQAHEAAFAHALKLAMQTRAELEILHVTPHQHSVDWSDLPHVRPMLARWGELPPDSDPEDVQRLGVSVDKAILLSRQPLAAIEKHFRKRPADLLVLTAHHHEELFSGLHEGVSLPLVWDCRIPALLIPEGGRGFVSAKDGSVRLQRVLIGAARKPDPNAAVHGAGSFAALFARRDLRLTALHVGDSPPRLSWRLMDGWTAEVRQASGSAAERILELAEEMAADLIVLATGGRKGIWEALFGSTAERVVRQASCPVLAIPEIEGGDEPEPLPVEDPQAAPAL